MVIENTDTGNALVEALLQHMQIDTEGFTETGRALLCIDGEITILIAVEGDTTRMIAPLGTAPGSASMLSAMLEENFRCQASGGYSYAIEPETKDLVMTQTLRAHDVDAAQFIERFSAMADYAARWTQALAAGSTQIPKPNRIQAHTPRPARGGAEPTTGQRMRV